MDKPSSIVKQIHTVETHYSSLINSDSSSDSSPSRASDKNLFWYGVAVVVGITLWQEMTTDSPVIINNQAPPPIIINNQ